MTHPQTIIADRIVPEPAAQGVIALAHYAGRRGFIPATSGNFSVRIDQDTCAITATGSDKTALTKDGIICTAIDGPEHPRASAEAPLHHSLYRLDASIGAITHVHAMSAVLASQMLAQDGRVRLQGQELLKAFRGFQTHESLLEVPVFENDQDMDRMASNLEKRWPTLAPTFGILLAGHGLYAWGRDVQETLRHLEAFDYLFTLALKLKGIPA